MKERRAQGRNLMVRAPDEASPPRLLDLVIFLLPRKAGVSGIAGILGSREKEPTPVVAAAFLESSGAVCS